MPETNRNLLPGRSRQLQIRADSRIGMCTVALVLMFAGCAKTDSDLPVTAVIAPDPNKTVDKEQLVKANPMKTEIEEAVEKAPPKKEVPKKANPNNAALNGKPAEEEPRLMKTNTLLMLTYQPDIRASKMVASMRPFISDEQAKKGKRLAFSYDWRFQKILRKRAEILENATDDQNIKAMLLATRVETADLIQEIRGRISQEILTPEQRSQVQERYQKE
jgi:hypothetical protein